METPPNRSDPDDKLAELTLTLEQHQARIAALERQGTVGPSTERFDLDAGTALETDKYVRATAYDALLRKYHEVTDRNRRWAGKCRDLERRLNARDEKYEDLRLKYHTARGKTRQWKEWYDDQIKRQKLQDDNFIGPKLSSEHPPEANVDVSAPANSDGIIAILQTGPVLDAAQVLPPRASSPSTVPDQTDELSTPKASKIQAPAPMLQRHPSSQSTEIPSSPPPAATQPKRGHSSEGEVEVISTRIVKKRKVDSTQPIKVKQEPVSQHGLIELNSDEFSSPHGRKAVVLPELLDLDSGAAPHQLRKKRNNCLTRTRSRSEEHIPRLKPSLLQHSSSLSQNGENNVVVREDLIPAQRPKANTGVKPAPGVLQPISANTPTPQRSTESANRVRKPNSSYHNKIDELSEGGEGWRSPRKGQNGSPSKELSAEMKGRLGGLLDGAVLMPQLDLLARTGSPIARIRNVREKPKTPVQKGLLTDNASSGSLSRPAMQSLTPKTAIRRADLSYQRGPSRLGDSASRPPSRHRQEPPAPPLRPALPAAPPKPPGPPLRLRPLSELRLDDFKINPKYQDTDFAFADTLRGRDARRCLQGCTKPDCCGGAFAELASTTTKGLSDAQVLESYLGPNWELMIGGYGPEKRQETLTNARTAAFANEFGKHKEVFARHSTPPGFWAADFPSTQEAEGYRALASQMEKGKIEERWREAGRDGGRWIFRDE